MVRTVRAEKPSRLSRGREGLTIVGKDLIWDGNEETGKELRRALEHCAEKV